ncbi:MAG: sensor histidine kinase [Chloroflexota bacterium]
MADSTRALLVQAQEEEHYRVARRLQNGPAQLLANATLEVETCLRLMDTQPLVARQGLTALLQELRQGLNDLRGVIAELQPPLLDELGLVPSLRQYTENLARQTGLVVQLSGWDALTERLPATMEVAIFRIVQEALDNVREHARASRVQVNLERAADQIVATISDNGQGFDNSRGAAAGRRLGLIAMRDRAELLNGNLQIFTEPGKGVRVVLTVPLRTPPPSY